MALPHLGGAYTSRKNIYEAVIVSKRNRENAYRQEWQNNAKFFNDYDVHATKQKAWESDASFHNSMDAWKAQQVKDTRKERLMARRQMLASLLRDETTQYHNEMEAQNLGIRSTDYMRDRATGLRSAREEKRQETARDKLYDHWRRNNPEVRQMESRQQEKHVIGGWQDQVREQREREERERLERERLEREMEEERQNAVMLEEMKQEEKLREEKELKDILKLQMDELKQREQEAEKYKLEQEVLLQRQWDLDQLTEQQKLREQERKQKEHGRILLRQHTAALKRKAREIKHELEQDRKFVEELIRQEQEEHRMSSARRDKARADASWMKQVIEEQIKVEIAREAELDMLYQDEAARIWQQREDEWSKERQAREKLLQQVLAERQDQVETRMEDIREKQRVSLERREEILQEMDMANQMTKRDLDEQEEEKKQRKRELLQQITARKTERQMERLQLGLEEEEEKEEEQNYEDLLREEAQRLGVQGFVEKNHRRKQAWL